jgi:hypothetical protein
MTVVKLKKLTKILFIIQMKRIWTAKSQGNWSLLKWRGGVHGTGSVEGLEGRCWLGGRGGDGREELRMSLWHCLL